MNKKFAFFALLILLVGSLGVVSAEDADDVVSDSVDLSSVSSGSDVSVGEQSIDLSQVSSNYDDEYISQDSDLQSPLKQQDSKKIPTVKGSETLREVHVEQQQQGPEGNVEYSSVNLVVNKYWEDDDSGSVSYVGIEVYKKVQERHVEQQQQESQVQGSEIDPLTNSETNITVNGIEYELVGRYNITKENGWKITLDSLLFYPDFDEDGNFIYSDGSFIVREVDLPDNVIPVSSNYSSHELVNGTFIFYWNLTNKVNETDEPVENTTPQVNETDVPVDNVTTPEIDSNETEKFSVIEANETSDDVGEVLSESSQPAEKKVLDVENATGNPLFVLLAVLAVLGIGLRRKD